MDPGASDMPSTTEPTSLQTHTSSPKIFQEDTRVRIQVMGKVNLFLAVGQDLALKRTRQYREGSVRKRQASESN